MKICFVGHIDVYVYFSAYDYNVVNFVWHSNILVYFKQKMEVFE